MFSINHTRKGLTIALGLTVAACVVTVPQAFAGGTHDTPQVTQAKPATLVDGRSPDTKDAASSAKEALASTNLSPVERIILQENARRNDPRFDAGAPRSADRSAIESSADGRAIERVVAQREAARRLRLGSFDGRSPDTIDAAVQAHAPVVTIVRSPGFGWRDFGIGAAAACGAMLLLGLSIRLMTNRANRKQPSPIATA